MTRAARGLRALVRVYQTFSAGRPPRCRFYPTCSAYAAEAIELHGAARGSWFTLKRLARCQPFGGFGVDPVPEPKA